MHLRLPVVRCFAGLAFATLLMARDAWGAIPADELLRSLKPSGDINDFAGVLSADERTALAERCLAMRQKTGAGFVVVILPSLQGGQIDDFAHKLFQQWGIGEKGTDNGLLLLVAIGDRKARLEVGYGLEPIIPDALAGRILDEQLFPAFKQQRYGDGLKAAVNRAAELIERGEPAPKNAGRKPLSLLQQLVMTLFFAVFVSIGSFLLGGGLGAKVGPLCLFGVFFGGVPYFMSLMMASPLAPIVLTPLGLFLMSVGYRTARNHPGAFRNASGTRTRRGSRGGGGTSYDPWMWQNFGGGSSSSSWGGGGFSSGSGSFGGGSSGGGGASGAW